MPFWAFLVAVCFVLLLCFLLLLMQRETHRAHCEAVVERALVAQRMELLARARQHGVRYEVHLVEWPNGGWRWTVWDADGALHPHDEAGVALPYAGGNAMTRADAEVHAMAEIAGLRLQERVDEVFVVA